MIEINSSTQTKLYGLDKYLLNLIELYRKDKLPNKFLLSGPDGIGKCTLAYHLINFILSEDEDNPSIVNADRGIVVLHETLED